MKILIKIPKTQIRFIVEVEEVKCYTCKYAHKENGVLKCWGEKIPPTILANDSCEAWKEKDGE